MESGKSSVFVEFIQKKPRVFGNLYGILHGKKIVSKTGCGKCTGVIR